MNMCRRRTRVRVHVRVCIPSRPDARARHAPRAQVGGYSTVSGTEEATIASVDAGGYCLDLTTPLQHDHLAEERSTVGPEAADSAEYRDHRVVQMRAEVALLTHNILVTGDDDSVYPAQYGVQIHVHSHGHESSTAMTTSSCG